MRVLFIQPRANQMGNFNLGLAYLCGVLHYAGHETLVLDLNHRKSSEGLDWLRTALDFGPDVIGFSCRSVEYREAVRLLRILKEYLPKARYILGGPHTALLDKCPAEFDAMFIGEAECVLPIHLSDLDGTIQALCVPQPGDDLPFPDFSTFSSKKYLTSYPLLTSRGCPFKCSYCSTHLTFGRKWRARDPGRCVEELRYQNDKYGFHNFIIVDDCFTMDIERAKNFCRYLNEINSLFREKFTWSCGNGIRSDGIDLELAKLMRDSGCHEVAFGIESADPEVFRQIGKSSSLDEIRKAIKLFRAVGVGTVGFFILGLPGSTADSDMKAIDFINENNLDRDYFNLAVPYPGTQLWEWVEKNGRWITPFDQCYHFNDGSEKINVAFDTPDYTAEERLKVLRRCQTWRF